jgi:hypothetical protein
VFPSAHQREALDLLFVHRNTMDDEILVVAKLKLVHGTILEFRAKRIRNGLNPSLEEEIKENIFHA